MSHEAITNAYVDHNYYSETYGGNSVLETEFKKYEIRSRKYIDKYTFKRVRYCLDNIPGFAIPEEILNAQCEIIDYLKTLDDNGGKEIASESVSKHSITYINKSMESKIDEIIKIGISAYPWRHRGIGGVKVETGNVDNPIQHIP